MSLSFEHKKLEELRWLCDKLDQEVTPRLVARILGKLLSMITASKVRFNVFLAKTARYLMNTVDMEAEWPDWDKPIIVPYEIQSEIEFVMARLPRWNTREIQQKTGLVYWYQQEYDRTTWEMYSGDASDDCCISYNLFDKKKFIHHFFPVHLRSLSSTHRELQTVVNLVESDKAPTNTRLIYVTDNQNVSRWVNSGTIREKSSALLRRIYLACWRKNITIRVAWVSRESKEVKVADLTMRLNTG